jgi:hypothetical protein
VFLLLALNDHLALLVERGHMTTLPVQSAQETVFLAAEGEEGHRGSHNDFIKIGVMGEVSSGLVANRTRAAKN